MIKYLITEDLVAIAIAIAYLVAGEEVRIRDAGLEKIAGVLREWTA
ncbi:MAG TPA: hypothetical protein VJ870_06800 [Amycolatopsis sp.]|nr:hypothetical protein [Amycolatopsis sp.]